MSLDYVYKTKPFDHQEKRFMKYRDKEYHGHLWEQGTGKSKMVIDTCAWLFNTGKIDAMLVIAPNGVHNNWIINEIPTHLPEYVDCRFAWYASSMTRKEQAALDETLKYKGLKIVSMNIEAFATVKGCTFAKNFVIYNDTLLVVDESSTIKNHKALRTKSILKLGKHAKYRRILTGTPVTQGPLDLFTQFTFLDEHILRTSSYYAFRARYSILKEIRTAGKSFMKVDGYYNLDELQKLIEPYSDRVTKDECLDLPEKLYQKHYVDLTPEQQKLYTEFKKEVLVEFEGRAMSAPLALTKLLRLQQIVGGFFQEDLEVEFDDDMMPIVHARKPPVPIGKVNPKINRLIEILGETNGKVIIWARFRSEIKAIVARIEEEFGHGTCVTYFGETDAPTRRENLFKFEKDDSVRYFVGHVQSGGKGLTLVAASTVVYFSNDFSLENRLQSEDRAHRIGQVNNVTYIDLIARGTLDEKIVTVLRSKKSIADLITGDEPLSSWV